MRAKFIMLQDKAPDIALPAGVGSAAYSWLGAATELAQLIAALLGIVATGLAIYWYILKVKRHKRQDRQDRNEQ